MKVDIRHLMKSYLVLLSLARTFLFFLVGFGFLVLTACESDDSSGGTSSRYFEVQLTFSPIAGGFVIGNHSNFGDLVSLSIIATNEDRFQVIKSNINIDQFSGSSYDFTGLNEQTNWFFKIIGTFSDGSQQEGSIVFVWEENRIDNRNGGLRPGRDTDGDRRADSVDDDDDNDDIKDNEGDDCPAGQTGWTSDPSTDHDGDGCQDASSEDTDDDNDGIGDNEGDQCPTGDIDWTSNPYTDYDGDGCRDASEDTDDDNDGIGDNEGDECPTGVIGWTSESLTDSDGNGCRDADEDRDDDSDGHKNGNDVDDDGDGLIELVRVVELDGVRYALRGNGRRLAADADLNTAGCGNGIDIVSCNGYELIANISLVDYANWQPLGHDTDSSRAGCQGAAFSGIFEGNGRTISNLSIDLSNRDCVGLFGHIAASATIRNLTLRAEAVIGRGRVGGLVGDGRSAQIVSSSVMVAEVKGAANSVGGLVGYVRSAQINSSSVVAEEVRGRDDVGGLVGRGDSARIVSSSVVAAEVRGSSYVGGLVGLGEGARVLSSSVVAGEVRGAGDQVGGLVGRGDSARIISSSVVAEEVSGVGNNVGGLVGWSRSARVHSCSVVISEVNGNENVGGLVGVGPLARILSSSVVMGRARASRYLGGLAGSFQSGLGRGAAYVYVVSGNTTASMLIGDGGHGGGVHHSYWDKETSGITTGIRGEGKTSDELRMPTNYTGIYANWDDHTDIFDVGGSNPPDDPLAVWCDKDNSGSIEESSEQNDGNLVWDFGTNMEYPAIRCTSITPAEWRSWWFLNRTGDPELNQTRLDALLPP